MSNDKLREIQERADRYRGKAAAIKAGRYTADVDALMAEIEQLKQIIDCMQYQLDTVYLDGELDFDDDDWDDENDDDWLDGNECRPFDDEPQIMEGA